MKNIGRKIVKMAILCGCLSVGGRLTEAVEMEVNVGIEFTEIEAEPIIPRENENFKKTVVKLPQTGEEVNKSGVLAGGGLVVGSSLFLFRRRKEGAKK